GRGRLRAWRPGPPLCRRGDRQPWQRRRDPPRDRRPGGMDGARALNPATWIDWVGTAAAILTTCSFVPQAWLTFRTRDVRGISLGMYSVFTVGVALWLAYGWLLGAWPVIVANAVTLVLACAILAMKIRFG